MQLLKIRVQCQIYIKLLSLNVSWSFGRNTTKLMPCQISLMSISIKKYLRSCFPVFLSSLNNKWILIFFRARSECLSSTGEFMQKKYHTHILCGYGSACLTLLTHLCSPCIAVQSKCVLVFFCLFVCLFPKSVGGQQFLQWERKAEWVLYFPLWDLNPVSQ